MEARVLIPGAGKPVCCKCDRERAANDKAKEARSAIAIVGGEQISSNKLMTWVWLGRQVNLLEVARGFQLRQVSVRHPLQVAFRDSVNGTLRRIF